MSTETSKQNISAGEGLSFSQTGIPGAGAGGVDTRTGQLMRVFSYYDSVRSGIATLLGVDGSYSLSTQRLMRNCLYPHTVTFRMYYEMYSRNNVAARIIETFPEYTWNVFPSVIDQNGPNSNFSKAVRRFFTTKHDWQDGLKQSILTNMKQLDVLGGIGGEALMVFGFKDGHRLDQPVAPRKNMEIAWVKLLHNGQFRIDSRIDNEYTDNYGDVLHYVTQDFSYPQDTNYYAYIKPGAKIHYSRVVHFKESAGLPYGVSRLQKCYNQLLDIAKLSGASAELYWLGAFSGLAIAGHKDSTIDPDSREEMQKEIEKYFEGLGRSLILEGADAKLLYPAIVSPKEHFDLQITMISIATGIPRRFLTGAEAAKLASQQDSINWIERVANRRDEFAGPKVVLPVVQRCIEAGVLPRPVGGLDGIEIIWPKTQPLPLNERANAARNMTEAIASYFNNNIHKIMPLRVFLTGVSGFSDDEAEKIVALCEDVKMWKPPVAQNVDGGSSFQKSGDAAKRDTDREQKQRTAALIRDFSDRLGGVGIEITEDILNSMLDSMGVADGTA